MEPTRYTTAARVFMTVRDEIVLNKSNEKINLHAMLVKASEEIIFKSTCMTRGAKDDVSNHVFKIVTDTIAKGLNCKSTHSEKTEMDYNGYTSADFQEAIDLLDEVLKQELEEGTLVYDLDNLSQKELIKLLYERNEEMLRLERDLDTKQEKIDELTSLINMAIRDAERTALEAESLSEDSYERFADLRNERDDNDDNE